MAKCSSRQLIFLLFNFLFLCLGLGLVGFVAWTLATIPNANEFISGTHVVTLTSFCLGFVIVIIGGIGCAAGFCKGLCILKTYVGFLLTLLFLELGLIFFIYAEKSQIPSVMIDSWDGLNTDTQYKIQSELECCGIQNYTEYGSDVESYPSSCFAVYDVTGIIEKTVDNLFTADCLTRMQTWLNDNVPIWVSVIVAIAVIECLSGLTSCIFLQRVQKKLKVEPENEDDGANADTEMADMEAGPSNDRVSDEENDNRMNSTGLIVVTPAPEQDIKDNTTIDYLSEKNVDSLSTNSNSDVKDETADVTESNVDIDNPSLILVASVSIKESAVIETKDTIVDNEREIIAQTKTTPGDGQGSRTDLNGDDSSSNRNTPEPSVIVVAPVTKGETSATRKTTESSDQDKADSSVPAKPDDDGDLEDDTKYGDNVSQHSEPDRSLIMVVPVNKEETLMDKEVNKSVANDKETLTRTTPSDELKDGKEDTISNKSTCEQTEVIISTSESSEKGDGKPIGEAESKVLNESTGEQKDEDKSDIVSIHSLPDPTLLIVASVSIPDSSVTETKDSVSNIEMDTVAREQTTPSDLKDTEDTAVCASIDDPSFLLVTSVSNKESTENETKESISDNEKEIVNQAKKAPENRQDSRNDDDSSSNRNTPEPSVILVASPTEGETSATRKTSDSPDHDKVDSSVPGEIDDDGDLKDDTQHGDNVSQHSEPDRSLITVVPITKEVMDKEVYNSVDNDTESTKTLPRTTSSELKDDEDDTFESTCDQSTVIIASRTESPEKDVELRTRTTESKAIDESTVEEKDEDNNDTISIHSLPDPTLLLVASVSIPDSSVTDTKDSVNDIEMDTVAREQTTPIDQKDTENTAVCASIDDQSLVLLASVSSKESTENETKESISENEKEIVAQTKTATENRKDSLTDDNDDESSSNRNTPEPSVILVASPTEGETSATGKTSDSPDHDKVDSLVTGEIVGDGESKVDNKDGDNVSQHSEPDRSLITVVPVTKEVMGKEVSNSVDNDVESTETLPRTTPSSELKDDKDVLFESTCDLSTVINASRTESPEKDDEGRTRTPESKAIDESTGEEKDEDNNDTISIHSLPDPTLLLVASVSRPDSSVTDTIDTVSDIASDTVAREQVTPSDQKDSEDTAVCASIDDPSLVLLASVSNKESAENETKELISDNEKEIVAQTKTAPENGKDNWTDDNDDDSSSNRNTPEPSVIVIASPTEGEMSATGKTTDSSDDDETDSSVPGEIDDDADLKDDTKDCDNVSQHSEPDRSLFTVAPLTKEVMDKEVNNSVDNDMESTETLPRTTPSSELKDDKDDTFESKCDQSTVIIASRTESPEKDDEEKTRTPESKVLNESTGEEKDEDNTDTISIHSLPDPTLLIVASVSIPDSSVTDTKDSVSNIEMDTVAREQTTSSDLKDKEDTAVCASIDDPSFLLVTSVSNKASTENESTESISDNEKEIVDQAKKTPENRQDSRTDDNDDDSSSNRNTPEPSVILVASPTEGETSATRNTTESSDHDEMDSSVTGEIDDDGESKVDNKDGDNVSQHSEPDRSLITVVPETNGETLTANVNTIADNDIETLTRTTPSSELKDDKDDTFESTCDKSAVIIALRTEPQEQDDDDRTRKPESKAIDESTEEEKDEDKSDTFSINSLPDPTLLLVASVSRPENSMTDTKDAASDIEADTVSREQTAPSGPKDSEDTAVCARIDDPSLILLASISNKESTENETKESNTDSEKEIVNQTETAPGNIQESRTDDNDDDSSSDRNTPEASLILVASPTEGETSATRKTTDSSDHEKVDSSVPGEIDDDGESKVHTKDCDNVSQHSEPDRSLITVVPVTKEVMDKEVNNSVDNDTEITETLPRTTPSSELKDDEDDTFESTCDQSTVLIASRTESPEKDDEEKTRTPENKAIDESTGEEKDEDNNDTISIYSLPDPTLLLVASVSRPDSSVTDTKDSVNDIEMDTVAREQTKPNDLKDREDIAVCANIDDPSLILLASNSNSESTENETKESISDNEKEIVNQAKKAPENRQDSRTDDNDDESSSNRNTPEPSVLVVASPTEGETSATGKISDSSDHDKVDSSVPGEIDHDGDLKDDTRDGDNVFQHSEPDRSLITVVPVTKEVMGKEVNDSVDNDTESIETLPLTTPSSELKDDEDDTIESICDQSTVLIASRTESPEKDDEEKTRTPESKNIDESTGEEKDEDSYDTISIHSFPDPTLLLVASVSIPDSSVTDPKDSVIDIEMDTAARDPTTSNDLKDTEDTAACASIEKKNGFNDAVGTLSVEQLELQELVKESNIDSISDQIERDTSSVIVASVTHAEKSDDKEIIDSADKGEVCSLGEPHVHTVDIKEDGITDIIQDIDTDHIVPEKSLVLLTTEHDRERSAKKETIDSLKNDSEETEESGDLKDDNKEGDISSLPITQDESLVMVVPVTQGTSMDNEVNQVVENGQVQNEATPKTYNSMSETKDAGDEIEDDTVALEQMTTLYVKDINGKDNPDNSSSHNISDPSLMLVASVTQDETLLEKDQDEMGTSSTPSEHSTSSLMVAAVSHADNTVNKLTDSVDKLEACSEDQTQITRADVEDDKTINIASEVSSEHMIPNLISDLLDASLLNAERLIERDTDVMADNDDRTGTPIQTAPVDEKGESEDEIIGEPVLNASFIVDASFSIEESFPIKEIAPEEEQEDGVIFKDGSVDDEFSIRSTYDTTSNLCDSESTDETSAEKEKTGTTEIEDGNKAEVEHNKASDMTDDGKEEIADGTTSDHGEHTTDPSVTEDFDIETLEQDAHKDMEDSYKNELGDNSIPRHGVLNSFLEPVALGSAGIDALQTEEVIDTIPNTSDKEGMNAMPKDQTKDCDESEISKEEIAPNTNSNVGTHILPTLTLMPKNVSEKHVTDAIPLEKNNKVQHVETPTDPISKEIKLESFPDPIHVPIAMPDSPINETVNLETEDSKASQLDLEDDISINQTLNLLNNDEKAIAIENENSTEKEVLDAEQLEQKKVDDATIKEEPADGTLFNEDERDPIEERFALLSTNETTAINADEFEIEAGGAVPMKESVPGDMDYETTPNTTSETSSTEEREPPIKTVNGTCQMDKTETEHDNKDESENDTQSALESTDEKPTMPATTNKDLEQTKPACETDDRKGELTEETFRQYSPSDLKYDDNDVAKKNAIPKQKPLDLSSELVAPVSTQGIVSIKENDSSETECIETLPLDQTADTLATQVLKLTDANSFVLAKLEETESCEVTNDGNEERTDDTSTTQIRLDSASKQDESISTEDMSAITAQPDTTDMEGADKAALEKSDGSDVQDNIKEETADSCTSDHGLQDPSLGMVALLSTAKSDQEILNEPTTCVDPHYNTDNENTIDTIPDQVASDLSPDFVSTVSSAERSVMPLIKESESKETLPVDQTETCHFENDNKEETSDDILTTQSTQGPSFKPTDETSIQEENVTFKKNENPAGDVTAINSDLMVEDTFANESLHDPLEIVTSVSTDETNKEDVEQTVPADPTVDCGKEFVSDFDSSVKQASLVSTDGKSTFADIENKNQDTTRSEQTDADTVIGENKKETTEDITISYGLHDSSLEHDDLVSTNEISSIDEVTEPSKEVVVGVIPIEQKVASDLLLEPIDIKTQDSSSSSSVSLNDTSCIVEQASTTNGNDPVETEMKSDTEDVTEDNKDEITRDTFANKDVDEIVPVGLTLDISNETPPDYHSEPVAPVSTQDISSVEETDSSEKEESKKESEQTHIVSTNDMSSTVEESDTSNIKYPETAALEKMDDGDATDEYNEEIAKLTSFVQTTSTTPYDASNNETSPTNEETSTAKKVVSDVISPIITTAQSGLESTPKLSKTNASEKEHMDTLPMDQADSSHVTNDNEEEAVNDSIETQTSTDVSTDGIHRNKALDAEALKQIEDSDIKDGGMGKPADKTVANRGKSTDEPVTLISNNERSTINVDIDAPENGHVTAESDLNIHPMDQMETGDTKSDSKDGKAEEPIACMTYNASSKPVDSESNDGQSTNEGTIESPEKNDGILDDREQNDETKISKEEASLSVPLSNPMTPEHPSEEDTELNSVGTEMTNASSILPQMQNKGDTVKVNLQNETPSSDEEVKPKGDEIFMDLSNTMERPIASPTNTRTSLEVEDTDGIVGKSATDTVNDELAIKQPYQESVNLFYRQKSLVAGNSPVSKTTSNQIEEKSFENADEKMKSGTEIQDKQDEGNVVEEEKGVKNKSMIDEPVNNSHDQIQDEEKQKEACESTYNPDEVQEQNKSQAVRGSDQIKDVADRSKYDLSKTNDNQVPETSTDQKEDDIPKYNKTMSMEVHSPNITNSKIASDSAKSNGVKFSENHFKDEKPTNGVIDETIPSSKIKIGSKEAGSKGHVTSDKGNDSDNEEYKDALDYVPEVEEFTLAPEEKKVNDKPKTNLNSKRRDKLFARGRSSFKKGNEKEAKETTARDSKKATMESEAKGSKSKAKEKRNSFKTKATFVNPVIWR